MVFMFVSVRCGSRCVVMVLLGGSITTGDMGWFRGCMMECDRNRRVCVYPGTQRYNEQERRDLWGPKRKREARDAGLPTSPTRAESLHNIIVVTVSLSNARSTYQSS